MTEIDTHSMSYALLHYGRFEARMRPTKTIPTPSARYRLRTDPSNLSLLKSIRASTKSQDGVIWGPKWYGDAKRRAGLVGWNIEDPNTLHDMAGALQRADALRGDPYIEVVKAWDNFVCLLTPFLRRPRKVYRARDFLDERQYALAELNKLTKKYPPERMPKDHVLA